MCAFGSSRRVGYGLGVGIGKKQAFDGIKFMLSLFVDVGRGFYIIARVLRLEMRDVRLAGGEFIGIGVEF